MNGLITMQDGRLVDLGADVTPELFAELEKPSPRGNPTAFCLKCGGGLYFQRGRVNRARLFGCHHRGADCNARHVAEVNRISDEHKRQVETVGIAAVRTGETFATEVSTTGRTRLDGLIGGKVGFEAQRSHLTPGAAVDRTRRSVAAAGLSAVLWGSDWKTDPAWTGRVPGWRYAGHFAWQTVPDPADVGVLGVQDVEMERIGSQWRPRLVPNPMTIQDIIEGTADGGIIPAVIARKVRLVTRKGDALWRGHTGQDTTWTAAAPPVPENGSAYKVDSECDRPAVSLTPARADDPRETPAARFPVLQFASDGVFCLWCHQAFTGEERRFRLTVHPKCADKRAAAYVAAGAVVRNQAGRGACRMTRETTAAKAHRYLVTGKLTVTLVDGDRVAATCRGDNGTYLLGHDPERPGVWWCTCPAQIGLCAHVTALTLVTVNHVRAPAPAELRSAS